MSAEYTPNGGDETCAAIEEVMRTLGETGVGSSMTSGDAAPEQAVAAQEAARGNRESNEALPLLDFEQFREEVLEKRRLFDEQFWPDNVPGYLGMGAFVGVFRIADESYAVKLPHPDDDEPEETVRPLAEVLMRGRGVPGIAQIVSYSESGPSCVVVEYVPGPTLAEIEARYDIWYEAYQGLLQTYRDMHNLGLVPDNASSNNTILTPGHKLVVVDYDYDPTVTLEEMVLSFGSDLALLQDENINEQTMPLPRYAKTFYDACRHEFGEELAEKLKEQWRGYGFEMLY